MGDNKKTEIVFIAGPAVGHIKPAIKLVNLLITRQQNLYITVLIMKLPIKTEIDNYIESLPSNPRINISILPHEEESALRLLGQSSFGALFIESHKGPVRDAVGEILSRCGKCNLGCIIFDWTCSTMIEVANEFGVANYIFYPSGAATVGLNLHMLRLRDDYNIDTTNFRNEDPKTEISINTYTNLFPVKCLPLLFVDNKEGDTTRFIDLSKGFQLTKGILINTFLELESYAIELLKQDKKVPPLYPIGPLLNLKDDQGYTKSTLSGDMIIQWLDDQPNSSVVFLCFGSLGFFDEDQTKEIACALENSGCRFVWALKRLFTPSDALSLAESLPEGFLSRTKNIGKVIEWAPQVEILSHRAIGGFVSHCGWNSILESIWFGVPIATWPIYAEQQANAFQLLKDLGIAVEIKMDYRRDWRQASPEKPEQIVKADVIENGIRDLMEPKSDIRVKVKEMKEKSRGSLQEGGSYDFLGQFIQDVMDNHQ